MAYTQENFQTDYSLSEQDVLETLNAIGISPQKKSYSQQDQKRFAEARKLYSEGAATSYEDLAAYFNQNNEQVSEGSDILSTLDEQAVQTGFELGSRQAEIMSEVIPKATMMRLTQMIESGEMKNKFQSYWKNTMKAGKSPDVDSLVEDYLETRQLAPTSFPTNLLNSSTESSPNDSESP